jgi:hypothetical protein
MNDDTHLWYTSLDALTPWQSQQPFPGDAYKSSDGPALAVFNKQLFMMWKGAGDNKLYWAAFNYPS